MKSVYWSITSNKNIPYYTKTIKATTHNRQTSPDIMYDRRGHSLKPKAYLRLAWVHLNP